MTCFGIIYNLIIGLKVSKEKLQSKQKKAAMAKYKNGLLSPILGRLNGLALTLY